MTPRPFPERARHAVPAPTRAELNPYRSSTSTCFSNTRDDGRHVRPPGFGQSLAGLDRRLGRGIAEVEIFECRVCLRSTDAVIPLSVLRPVRPLRRNAAPQFRFEISTSQRLIRTRGSQLHGIERSYLPCLSLAEIRSRTSSQAMVFTFPESSS